MIPLLRFAIAAWALLEILRATDPLTIPADRPRRERTSTSTPPRTPTPAGCPKCTSAGHTSELLMSDHAVYCTRCGWGMTVTLDLEPCQGCGKSPAAIEWDGRHLCIPCRIYVVG